MKNKLLSCIVIDDSELDRKSIETELSNYPDLKLSASFDNGLEALSFFKTHQSDVLFVDIDMPEITGLDFIKAINQTKTIPIIVSSHPEFALEGFQLNVFDFILKPVETNRFNDTVLRLRDFIKLKEKAEAYDVLFENEKVIFKDGHNTLIVSANEILYLEAYGDYTKIVTENKSHLTLAALSSFVESLPAGKFLRIHRSYVIAINKVKALRTKNIEIGINILPVGKTYIREAKQIFKAN